MLEQYQTEIFGLIAILVVILIWVVTKKKSSPADETPNEENSEKESIEIDETSTATDVETEAEPEEVTPQKEVQETPQEPIAEVEEETEEKPEDTLDGSEEGTFEDKTPTETPHNRKSDTIEHIKPKHYIKKRSVPPHDKITKNNFKEFAGQRILVAEDNIINQKVIKGLLADTGIDIVIADDGQECLEILEKDSDFLLILMDAHMPRIDGFEATRQIRANPNYEHILVVALSGDTAADDIKKMTEAGMSEQLEKPLRMDALYDIFYAYTGEQTQIDDSNEVNVIMTKELNGDYGLNVCGGDEEFYGEILTEFVTTYENSTQKLGELLRAGELKAADRLLLDLVGVTANIGAQNLNDISLIIKASLNDTTEKSYLTLIDQYKTSLDNLIKDIKEYQ